MCWSRRGRSWPHSNRGRTLGAADLATLPEDCWLYELVAGRLVRMPPPNGRHGYLEAEIGGTLRAYSKAHGLGRVYVGETGFDLTLPGEPLETVLGADVAFLRAGRTLAEGDDEAYIAGAPDLVVEIASPSPYRPEMEAKAWLWLQRGTRLVWVVWPQRHQVDVWTPGQDAPVSLTIADMLDGGEVLPGLTYRLADLFS